MAIVIYFLQKKNPHLCLLLPSGLHMSQAKTKNVSTFINFTLLASASVLPARCWPGNCPGGSPTHVAPHLPTDQPALWGGPGHRTCHLPAIKRKTEQFHLWKSLPLPPTEPSQLCQHQCRWADPPRQCSTGAVRKCKWGLFTREQWLVNNVCVPFEGHQHQVACCAVTYTVLSLPRHVSLKNAPASSQMVIRPPLEFQPCCLSPVHNYAVIKF